MTHNNQNTDSSASEAGANGNGRAAESGAQWSVSETLSGRTLLVTGTTGFLGKVYLSLVLRFHPDIDQIYLLIRARKNQTAEERFFDTIASSGAMDPVRETYGDGYLDLLKDKITPLDGDITETHLGLDEEDARALSSQIDVIINSAGLTNFNPNLESALTINALAQRNFLDFVRLGDNRASLMHVSTCFVAGNVDGRVPEELPGPTDYPKYDDIQEPYDAEREIEDCLAMISHAKSMADDQEHQTQFAAEARERIREKNLDPTDQAALSREISDLRWKWLRDRLSDEGRERAAFWGWPNIYTYTKSLGERLLRAARDEVNLCVFRPAVVESAIEYPEPGWNEGINTTAPLLYLMSKGHRMVPTRDKLRFDAIPVDYVAGGMVAATAALIRKEQRDVYHSGSSHLNPVTVGRLVELSSLANRKARNRDTKQPKWQTLLLNSLDGVAVDKKTFERRSAPSLNKAASGLKGLLEKVPTKHLGGFGKAVEAVKGGVETAERLTHTSKKVFELFMPFIHDNNYEFRSDHLLELSKKLPAAERERYGVPVQDMSWRHYWMDVHIPGLNEHVFPALDEKFRGSSKSSYTYDDLIEMFDASTANFGSRVAMQHHDEGISERYTYSELQEYATRAVDALQANGVSDNTTAMLVSENRPQWGMAYFGILKAGGVAVPVDPESSAEELANLMRSSHARVAVLSEAVWERIGDELETLLEDESIPARLLHFGQLFSLALPEEPETAALVATDSGDADLPAPPTDILRATEDGEPIASLIFTSGTTGRPKGVMLTHKNFTSLLASLKSTFDVDERDGFLSVLPLHHTFEFACGFLMPLSRGSTITYMEELSSEELTSALGSTDVTALIGVPALWQLLDRRIRHRLEDLPAPASWGLDQLARLNKTLRDRIGINVGRTIFGAIHRAFGGKLEYLISGGAALPSDVLETFYGLGFDLYEGYGLTEAAPVLTVNRPDRGFNPGKVGKALPGVEVDIHDPDDDGVGEVIARGDNIMRGYLGLDDETDRAIEDGWLHTGDLGQIDDSGRLEIVGREKEVIVTSGGKNVYPDELEDVYSKCPQVEELSIVGMPDGSGSERVACLVRPDVDEDATDEERAEAEAKIRDWFRVEGTRMASQKRVRVLRFWYEDFPRTATRKIKRTAVVDILDDLHKAEHKGESFDPDEEREWEWLYEEIAELADVDTQDIHASTHFIDDLGFDSLMVVELAGELESHDFNVATQDLANIYTVGQLQELLDRDQGSTAMVRTETTPIHKRVDEFPIHPALADAGRHALEAGQMKAYEAFFDVEVYGRANIPWHDPNVIVAANHTSHLDMGLVKYALGDFGRDIRALAAADYFFGNPLYKTYFNNFTNLIPVERSGTMEQALSGAARAIHRGETILVFPEGTRSTNGKLQDFKRGVGYLAAHERVDILPLYIEGTYRALPKGQSLPSVTSRKLKVYIGQPINTRSVLSEFVGEPDSTIYQEIADRAHATISALRDAADDRGGTDEDLQPLFSELNDKFESSNVSNQLSFYFSLGNVDSHKWTVTVDSKACEIQSGKPSGRADCVIKTSPAMFKRIVRESYVPSMDEFMSGEIKTNDPQLLAQFQTIFRL